MTDDIEKLSLALPILIFPVERQPRKVITTTSIFVILSLIFAIFASYILKYLQGQVSESASPVEESELGALAAFLNLLYFLAIVILTTLAFVFLINRGKILLLRNVLIVLISYLLFMFTFLMSFFVGAFAVISLASFLIIDQEVITILLTTTAFVLATTFTTVYIVSSLRGTLLQTRNIILSLDVSWMGVWLGWNLGELTPIFLLIGFAIYDLYSVFKGPLRELAKTLHQKTVELGRESKFGFGLGLGDIFFYTLAVGYSFAMLNPIETLAICAVVVLGVLLTVILLFKLEAEALPALPIPILSAVILLLLFRYLV